jgi:hypothetical protein
MAARISARRMSSVATPEAGNADAMRAASKPGTEDVLQARGGDRRLVGVSGVAETWSGPMKKLLREERLQIMLADEELNAVDDWRFDEHMPSRAAAIRELLRRGLAAEGI